MSNKLSLLDVLTDDVQYLVLLRKDGQVQKIGYSECEQSHDPAVNLDDLAAVLFEKRDGSLTALDVADLPPWTLTSIVEVPVGNPTKVSYKRQCWRVEPPTPCQNLPASTSWYVVGSFGKWQNMPILPSGKERKGPVQKMLLVKRAEGIDYGIDL